MAIYLFIYLSSYLFVLSHNDKTRLDANNKAGPSENRTMGRKKSQNDNSSDGGGGGGAFFLACEDFGRMFDHAFPACAI